MARISKAWISRRYVNDSTNMIELEKSCPTDFENVENVFLKTEKWKIESYERGHPLPKYFGELYREWEQGFLPISQIGNLQMGVCVNPYRDVNGTYSKWKEYGGVLTPNLVCENIGELRDDLYKQWLYRSNCYGLEWIETQIMNGSCPPILVSNRTIFQTGDILDGQHRAVVGTRLYREKKVENIMIPVFLGKMTFPKWMIYNAYVICKSNLSMEEKLKLFKQRYMEN